MADRYISGVRVPEIASASEFRQFVNDVYESAGENYSQAAQEIGGGFSPATIWKLVTGEQKDSPSMRRHLGIRKTAPRPRAEIRTNNLDLAIRVFLTHYPECQIIDPNGWTYRRRPADGTDNLEWGKTTIVE